VRLLTLAQAVTGCQSADKNDRRPGKAAETFPCGLAQHFVPYISFDDLIGAYQGHPRKKKDTQNKLFVNRHRRANHFFPLSLALYLALPLYTLQIKGKLHFLFPRQ
jgi:hypothetical protein